MSIPSASYNDVVDQCLRVAQQGRNLRPGQRQIAAFDADGTLWAQDVAEILWQRLVESGTLREAGAGPLARAVRSLGHEPSREARQDYMRLLRLYREGRCPEETMVRAMLSGLAGIREDDLYECAREAIGSVDDLKSQANGRPADMIRQLRAQGFHIVVVSSSPRWVVEVAVDGLGIEPRDVVAGQVAVVEGVLTSSIIEPLPQGQGKIQALLRSCGSVPHVSVGNTINDLALLEAASHLKLLVNPTDDLVAACEEIGGSTWSMATLDLHSGPAHRRKLRQTGVNSTGPMPAIKPPRPRADS
jgi:phosphoserine phosphatase